MLFWFFSVGIGLAFGIASVFWLKFIFNDTVAQITVTLSASYFAYYTVCSSLLHNLVPNGES
jgi:heme O synthase-like polyprenyltransferase